MKKKFSLLISILISLSLVSCNDSTATLSNHQFPQTNTTLSNEFIIETSDDGRIDKIVSDLCSDEYMSRVVGTKENLLATKYIENFFRENNISPFNGTDYLYSIDHSLNVLEYLYGDRNDVVVTKELHNVASVIKGSDSKNAVFVTAHFDHVNDLQGAIDNASGVSVMLEVAHKIKNATENNPLSCDIVFVAFNSEETGLDGSTDFVSKYCDMYESCYNINIDCVGHNDSSALAMGCDYKASKALYAAMTKTFDEENIKYTDESYASKNGRVYGTSDHLSFIRKGYPALVLGDNNILDIVHTCDDTIDAIDFDKLDYLTTAVAKFIVNNNGNMFN